MQSNRLCSRLIAHLVGDGLLHLSGSARQRKPGIGIGVILAKAGIRSEWLCFWIPAGAGMTVSWHNPRIKVPGVAYLITYWFSNRGTIWTVTGA